MVFSRRDDQHPHPYPLPQPSGRGAFGKEAGGVHGSSTNPARMKMGAAASMARDVGTNRLFVILRRLAQDDEFVAWCSNHLFIAEDLDLVGRNTPSANQRWPKILAYVFCDAAAASWAALRSSGVAI